MQILYRRAVAVVIDIGAKGFQRRQVLRRNIQALCQTASGVFQVVTESAGHSPVEVTAIEVSIHQRRSAHISSFIDDGCQVGMLGNVTREMMIHIEY